MNKETFVFKKLKMLVFLDELTNVANNLALALALKTVHFGNFLTRNYRFVEHDLIFGLGVPY